MRELTIASGKGGTGKTSIVASLARLSGDNALVDCDVDAANLHLIVDHEVKERHSFSTSKRASIDVDKCTGCDLCREWCVYDAIHVRKDDGTYYVDPHECEGCGLCYHCCPEEAVNFEPVVSGEWFRSETPYGPFLHGRLGIAESNSGRLVSLLRTQAHNVAEDLGKDLVIADGPPGIGCPVIASITGANYLLIVTEPSLSAQHDLDRLLQLASHFEIRVGVLINKFDINTELSERLERDLDKKGISVVGTIPFDKKFIEAQVNLKSYIDVAEKKARRRIEIIWENIQAEIEKCGARVTEIQGLRQTQ